MSNVTRTWKLNGKSVTVRAPAGRRLLDVLRDDLGLTGSKESCGEGECGACTVLVDDEPMVSCLIPVGQLPNGTEILTIEGIARKAAGRVIQQAYIECGAVQCGFCTPGMILVTKALLDKNPHPTHEEIKKAFAVNLCRCTGYQQIFNAVELAAKRL